MLRTLGAVSRRSLVRRRFSSSTTLALESSTNPHITFIRPFYKPRRLRRAGFALFGIGTAWFFTDLSSISVEYGDKEEAQETQDAATDVEPNKENGNEVVVEGWYLPLTLPKERPLYYYTQDDPEWQLFQRVGPDLEFKSHAFRMP